ncbi:hypothetical protein TIFTF001_039625 [Ficus carica]|uniref:Uncharacterized protein n=1 Tax=Ficus carica TaxID=3494 RepID=A0AA88E9I6_FICCA|nr:hypothetical protein TIFTF001_039625 [Ficus carica]
MGNLSHARNDVGDYWKSMMKYQTMPESIRSSLFDQDLSSDFPGSTKLGRFVENFEARSSAIIYQSHNSKPQGENKQGHSLVQVGEPKEVEIVGKITQRG